MSRPRTFDTGTKERSECAAGTSPRESHRRLPMPAAPYLPVDIDDPVQRLQAVHDRMRSLCAGHEPEGGASVTTLAEYGPLAPVSSGIRLGLRLPATSGRHSDDQCARSARDPLRLGT
jgi:hypothetical protein